MRCAQAHVMIKQISSASIEELYSSLGSGPQGLSAKYASERLNQVHQRAKKQSRFQREFRLFISQFTNPLVLLLVVAVILSGLLGETSDTFIILFILVATGVSGFIQELNAGRAVEKLQSMIALTHHIIRDGKEIHLKTSAIVAGDVIVLVAGDIIPADCRIIESNELHVNESAFTGESFPVEKNADVLADDTPLSKKHNCLWQGTNVISGTARALIINIGDDTVFGQLTSSLLKTPETAFEKGIKNFGYFLLQVTVILAVFILAVNIYFGKPLFDSMLFSLALAVGMAPELLPAIMTFAMSMGARKMMNKKVVVKKLSSIFNLGEVDILCTDKTGTITEGSMKLFDVVNPSGQPDGHAKLLAFLNAHFQNGFPNAVDDALNALQLPLEGYEKADEIPYDFIRKRLSICVSKPGENLLISKGAFHNIIEVCSYVAADNISQPLDISRKAALERQFADFCERGYRVLGLSYKHVEKTDVSRADEVNMIFVGFVLLEDPLKENAFESIQKLTHLNISLKIITGDNRYSAAYTTQKLGITNPKIITGEALLKMSPEALVIHAKSTDVFAEVEPHQKEQIIKALQKGHSVVAYIGDGINDVAAIHAADTGISTNNAVDVAKEAADFVLLEKDLSVLADGIDEGRKSFFNSMKYIFITTGATFGNMFSVAAASLFLPFLPMLPKQILMTNFITDFPFLFIATDNVDKHDLKKPSHWNMKLIRNFMITFGIHSSLFDFLTFYALYYYFDLRDSAFQTGWFLESVMTELVIIFIIRTKKPFMKSKPGKWLLTTSAFAFLFTVLLPVSPFADLLGLSIAHVQQAIALAIIMIAYVLTADVVKTFFFKANRML